jgi:hypothetical protein
MAGLATRQHHEAVAESRGLVRENDLAVRRLAERVFVRLALLAERFGRRDRLAEVVDDLLDRLRMQAGEKAFDFGLEIIPGWPLSAELPDGRMALDQPGPEPRGLLPDGGEDQPPLGGRRKPGEFYRAVRHATSIPMFTLKARAFFDSKYNATPYIPSPKGRGITANWPGATTSRTIKRRCAGKCHHIPNTHCRHVLRSA